MEFFRQFGLFREEDGGDKKSNGPYLDVDRKVRALYSDIEQSCLDRAEGNQRDADYLQDCTYFEYFWRIVQYNTYAKRVKAAMKKAQQKFKK